MGTVSKVVTFTKRTTVGTQAITGIGFQPRAIIFFWSGATANNSARNSLWQGAGFAARGAGGGITQYSASWSDQHLQASSNSSRRIANKAITSVQYGETTESEADLISFDADGFTLDWTTVSASGFQVSALCIGGSSLTDASIITWNTPGATGSQAVTGLGFRPDVLFTMRTNTSSGNTSSGALGFGMTDGTNSSLAAIFDVDASTTMDNSRGQRTGQVVGTMDSTATWTNLASLTSFDSDGFTLNWSARSNTALCIGLAIKGGSYKVGTTAKSTSTSVPVTQTVSSLGFRPAAVFTLSTYGGTLTGAGTSHALLAMGASDGSNNSGQIARAESGVSDSNSASYHKNAKATIKINPTANSLEAEASITLSVSSFSWIWSTNDAVGSNIGWMAIGPVASSSSASQVVAAA